MSTPSLAGTGMATGRAWSPCEDPGSTSARKGIAGLSQSSSSLPRLTDDTWRSSRAGMVAITRWSVVRFSTVPVTRKLRPAATASGGFHGSAGLSSTEGSASASNASRYLGFDSRSTSPVARSVSPEGTA
ncbi:MAG: hypothetical protein R2711_14925 [Acidimicrobiales bacterium]